MKVEKRFKFAGDDRYTNNIRDRVLALAMEAYADLAGDQSGPGDFSKLPPFSEDNELVVTVEVAAGKKKNA